MNWFRSAAEARLREENKVLRMQLMDVMEKSRQLQEEYGKEREKLVDKIIALSNPSAYAALHPRERVQAPQNATPQRLHWPGLQPSRRPIIQAEAELLEESDETGQS